MAEAFSGESRGTKPRQQLSGSRDEMLYAKNTKESSPRRERCGHSASHGESSVADVMLLLSHKRGNHGDGGGEVSETGRDDGLGPLWRNDPLHRAPETVAIHVLRKQAQLTASGTKADFGLIWASGVGAGEIPTCPGWMKTRENDSVPRQVTPFAPGRSRRMIPVLFTSRTCEQTMRNNLNSPSPTPEA